MVIDSENIDEDMIEEMQVLADKCVDDLSRFFLDMFQNYDGPISKSDLGGIAAHAAFTFVVSTMMAMDITEEKAHEYMNSYYTNLSPFVDTIKRSYQN